MWRHVENTEGCGDGGHDEDPEEEPVDDQSAQLPLHLDLLPHLLVLLALLVSLQSPGDLVRESAQATVHHTQTHHHVQSAGV